MDLSGTEFKSLPSGLHNVKEDLVYFLQNNDHAGLSAFRNDESNAADRNASFACVGACVPLNGTRLGRIWLHAPELRRLAGDMCRSHGVAGQDALEQYWEEYRLRDDDYSTDKGKKYNQQRRRGLSESVTLTNFPSSFHPAHAIPDLLDAFGPLIFPLYRIALLRKRCLIIRRPPVRSSCDFIYILSILTSLPSSLHSAILPSAPTRSLPKFSVGISDMADLEPPNPPPADPAPETPAEDHDDALRAAAESSAYLATTTDELLALKPALYDYKIEFPAAFPAFPAWPTITAAATATPLKATQKDWRRYRALLRSLRRLRADAPDPYPDDTDTDADTHPLLPSAADNDDDSDPAPPANPAHVEALPWAAIAYDSFVWWASAGERPLAADDEARDFAALLATSQRPGSAAPASVEALVAYFHRWTAQVLGVLGELIGGAEAEDGVVGVRREELARMGLEGWSDADRAFVREVAAVYYGVEVEVGGARVECCGVRML